MPWQDIACLEPGDATLHPDMKSWHDLLRAIKRSDREIDRVGLVRDAHAQRRTAGAAKAAFAEARGLTNQWLATGDLIVRHRDGRERHDRRPARELTDAAVAIASIKRSRQQLIAGRTAGAAAGQRERGSGNVVGCHGPAPTRANARRARQARHQRGPGCGLRARVYGVACRRWALSDRCPNPDLADRRRPRGSHR